MGVVEEEWLRFYTQLNKDKLTHGDLKTLKKGFYSGIYRFLTVSWVLPKQLPLSQEHAQKSFDALTACLNECCQYLQLPVTDERVSDIQYHILSDAEILLIKQHRAKQRFLSE